VVRECRLACLAPCPELFPRYPPWPAWPINSFRGWPDQPRAAGMGQFAPRSRDGLFHVKPCAGIGVGCPVPGARCPVPGARCPVPGARCPVPGARCPVPGARCPVFHVKQHECLFWSHCRAGCLGRGQGVWPDAVRAAPPRGSTSCPGRWFGVDGTRGPRAGRNPG
jgi:hypothetical protein